MSNNRTEQEAAIQSLAPTVDLVELQAAINTDGYVFKKDVAVSVGGAVSIADFTDNDQVIVNSGGANVAITITGVENGQRGKLVVVKGASDTVSFVGIYGTVDGSVIGRTQLHYDVWSANGRIYLTNVNHQHNGSFTAGDYTLINADGSTGTIDWQINNNILNIWGEITTRADSSNVDTIIIEITDRSMGEFFRTNKDISGSGSVTNEPSTPTALQPRINDNGAKYQIILQNNLGLFSESFKIYLFSFAVKIK